MGGLEGKNTKEKMELRIREVDQGGGGLTGTRASEAPFSRREEGWELGEEKEKGVGRAPADLHPPLIVDNGIPPSASSGAGIPSVGSVSLPNWRY